MAVKTPTEISSVQGVGAGGRTEKPTSPTSIPVTYPPISIKVMVGSGSISGIVASKSNIDAVRMFAKYEQCAKVVLLAELTLTILSALIGGVLIILGCWSNFWYHMDLFKAFDSSNSLNVHGELDGKFHTQNLILLTGFFGLIASALNLGLAMVLAKGIKQADWRKSYTWMVSNLILFFMFLIFGTCVAFNISYHISFIGFLILCMIYKFESVFIIDKYIQALRALESVVLTV